MSGLNKFGSFLSVSMSELVISTITICGRLTPHIPLKELACACTQFISNSKKRPFLNQLTILVPIPNSQRVINTKIFKNGKIQTSGSKDANEFRYVAELFQKYTNSDLVDEKIVMMNSSFNMGSGFELPKIAAYFSQLGLKTTFDQMRHPPCNVKFFINSAENGICNCLSRGVIGKDEKTVRKKKCDCTTTTCLIFRSGKIVLTGAENLNDLQLVRLFLIQHLSPFIKK
jgi:TATA-box binding protein (TBP) (component of TFIID and TFIIIB)